MLFFFLVLLLSTFGTLSLFALSVTFSLPRGIPKGIRDLSIDEAVSELKNSKLEGLELVEACRQLIISPMFISLVKKGLEQQ